MLPASAVEPLHLGDRGQVLDRAQVAAWALEVLVVEAGIEQHPHPGPAPRGGEIGVEAGMRAGGDVAALSSSIGVLIHLDGRIRMVWRWRFSWCFPVGADRV